MKRPHTLHGLLLAAIRIHAGRLAPEARAVLLGLAVIAVALLGAFVLRTCTPHQRTVIHVTAWRPPPLAFVREASSRAGSGLALQPALATANDVVGVTWVDVRSGEPDVYFARVNANGARIGTELRITRGGFHFLPQIAWTGRDYLITWTEQRDEEALIVNLARVGADGRPIGAPRALSAAGQLAFAQDVACSANGCLAAWYQLSGMALVVNAVRLTPAGEPSGQPQRIAMEGVPLGTLDLSWNGQGYGAVWSENGANAESSTEWFVPFDADGKAGSRVRVATASSYSGASAIAARNGEPFSIVWEAELGDDGTATLNFASASSRGVDTRPRAIAEAGLARVPALIAAGSDSGLAWTDIRDGKFAIAFARIARDGRLTTQVARLTDGSRLAFGPTLAFDGRDVLVAWTERGDNGFAIALARVGPDGRPRGTPVHIAETNLH
jgi:hypothetical protein